MAKFQPSILISSEQGKLENQSFYTHVRVVFQNNYEAAILTQGKKNLFGLFSVFQQIILSINSNNDIIKKRSVF